MGYVPTNKSGRSLGPEAILGKNMSILVDNIYIPLTQYIKTFCKHFRFVDWNWRI